MRRWMAVPLVALLALALGGCSLREVQLWFAFNQHVSISREQAKDIADLVNAKRAPGGCDANYAGTCVPDTATQVHCAGTSGDGPAVRGPFTIAGWDSFELDPDGDKHVCDSPVGSFDALGQQVSLLHIKGWAFDPDTTSPVQLAVSVNGWVETVAADESRGDLEAALPGVGANHGFDFYVSGFDPGDHADVCVVAINVGTGSNTTLACKNLVMADLGYDDAPGNDVWGMIEGLDVQGSSVHVRGFAFGVGASPRFFLGGAYGEPTEITSAIVYGRPEIAAVIPGSPPAVGFDLVMPTPTDVLRAGGLCLSYLQGATSDVLMCRLANT